MKPLVTIGVCARNCEDIVAHAIDSILSQNYPSDLMELILVDDGSEDHTLAILKSYACHTNISIRVFSHNWRGLGFTRNLIIKKARGKYLLWVDCDEVLESGYVRKQVAFLDEHPEIGVSVGLIALSKKNLITKLDLLPFLLDRLRYIQRGSPLRPLGTGGATYRIEILRRVGGFDEALKGAGEDIDLGYRLESLGWLMAANDALYWEKKGGIRSITELLRRYFWYGYGNHKVHWKNSKTVGFATMNPIVAFISGALYGFEGYRLKREKKLIVLLPATFALKYSAWCIGFTKSHIENLLKNTN